MIFFNSTTSGMNIEDVVKNITEFISKSPDSIYRIAVGTDSQVKGSCTCFATGIHIHRVGYGAWCCISKQIEPRRYRNLKEKIAKETAITYELAYTLNEMLMGFLAEYSMKHKGFEIKLEAHLDLGRKGETRKLIREMTGFFEGMGIETKIKPDSYVASSYANRHSKNIRVS